MGGRKARVLILKWPNPQNAIMLQTTRFRLNVYAIIELLCRWSSRDGIGLSDKSMSCVASTLLSCTVYELVVFIET